MMQATKTIGLVLSLFFFTLSSCKKSSKTLPRKPGSSKQSAASKSPGQLKDSPDQIAKDLAAAAAQAREECEATGGTMNDTICESADTFFQEDPNDLAGIFGDSGMEDLQQEVSARPMPRLKRA